MDQNELQATFAFLTEHGLPPTQDSIKFLLKKIYGKNLDSGMRVAAIAGESVVKPHQLTYQMALHNVDVVCVITMGPFKRCKLDLLFGDRLDALKQELQRPENSSKTSWQVAKSMLTNN